MNQPYESTILRFIGKNFLVPLMIVFAVYVLIHGESSPGGGFQAGAIFASAIILVRLIGGNTQTKGLKSLPMPLLIVVASNGLGIYVVTGILAQLFGANYLDYAAIPLQWFNEFAGENRTNRAMGMWIIELGVFLGVASVLVIIFDLLSKDPKND